MRGKLLSISSLLVGAALVLGACGGSSSKSGVGTTPTTAKTAGGATVSTGSDGHVLEAAGANPSASAKMVCATEAINEIAGVLGVKSTQPNPPTWKDHVYSCDYVYPGGAKMNLAVKEMSSVAETTAYYDMMQTKYGNTQEIQIPGSSGSFVTKDGDVVVRKDYKVLHVNVQGLPANFAGDTRSHDAINVAATVMGCWTGA